MKDFNPRSVRRRCGVFLLCLLSLLFITSCLTQMLKKPSFILRGIKAAPRSLTEMNLLFDLEAQNPSRFDMTLKSFECTVYLRGENIGTGSLKDEILIPSSSKTELQVPVTATFKNLSEVLKVIFAGGDVPYKIEGTADFGTTLGSFTFPFSKEGSIDLSK